MRSASTTTNRAVKSMGLIAGCAGWDRPLLLAVSSSLLIFAPLDCGAVHT